ncbi:MAG: HEAT repeat domain-containing protein [Planctomycetota bacterium]
MSAALVALTAVVAGAQESEAPDAKLQEKVTVTFAQTPLHFVLEELGKRTEANIVLTPSVDRWETSVTLSASEETLDKVLGQLQQQLKLERTTWAGAIFLHAKGKQLPEPSPAPGVKVKGARALRLPVNVQHERTPLADVVARLEKRTEIPMSLPARVRVELRKHGVRVTLRLYRMPVYEVLDQVALQCGLTWSLEDGRVTFALREAGDAKGPEVDTLKFDVKKTGLKLAGPEVDVDGAVERLRAPASRSAATRELILIGKDALPKVGALVRNADKSADPPTISAGLKVIAELRDPIEYDAVLKVFKDKEQSIDLRIQAADTLAAIRPPEAVPDLVEALDDPTSLRLAEGARRALVGIGPASVPALAKAYKAELEKTKGVREGLLYRALLIFGEINTDATKSLLLKALQQTKGERAVPIRHHAAIGLGFTNDPQVIPVLVKALEEEKDFLISKYITRSLTWITDEQLPPDGRRWRVWWENVGKRRYGKNESAEDILKRLAGGEIQLELDQAGYAKLNETVEQRIERLLRDLGGDDPVKVRAAGNDLVALGEKALPRLREVAKGSDARAKRAGALVTRILERLGE